MALTNEMAVVPRCRAFRSARIWKKRVGFIISVSEAWPNEICLLTTWCFTFLATVGLAARVLAADFFIHDGDRVVFLGDSITEQRLYTTYVEAYALTRHPPWQLSFRNVGWGGDTAWLRQRSHPDEGQLFAADEARPAGDGG